MTKGPKANLGTLAFKFIFDKRLKHFHVRPALLGSCSYKSDCLVFAKFLQKLWHHAPLLDLLFVFSKEILPINIMLKIAGEYRGIWSVTRIIYIVGTGNSTNKIVQIVAL